MSIEVLKDGVYSGSKSKYWVKDGKMILRSLVGTGGYYRVKEMVEGSKYVKELSKRDISLFDKYDKLKWW